MAEPTLLDRTYSIIINGFVETGQAPHYTELAADLVHPLLGLSMSELRDRLPRDNGVRRRGRLSI